MTGPLADLELTTLASFTLGAFVAMSVGVFVSGYFPRHQAPDAGPLGRILVYCSLAALVGLIAILAMVGSELPVAVAIVAAGLAILGAPFLVDPLPIRVRESRLSLIAAFVLCSTAALAIQTGFMF